MSTHRIQLEVSDEEIAALDTVNYIADPGTDEPLPREVELSRKLQYKIVDAVRTLEDTSRAETKNAQAHNQRSR